jgi:LysR family transcriptional regulator, transcriptional activator of the cysJI operon
MFDFRLKVFYIVAKRLNFTKAAEELFITQPAVSKHIHEIESFYKTKLFDRKGTKIRLTDAGAILLKHAEVLMEVYRNIDFDLATPGKGAKGMLKIGASTTVASYFLPQYLSSFRQKYKDVKLSLTAHNTETIENLLAENKIDLGIVEGRSKRPQLKYTGLVQDSIILCARAGNPAIKKTVITAADLLKLPFVMREAGSGSREVIVSALKKAGINPRTLNVELELENTESIKSYLLNSDAVAFLSIHSVRNELKTGELKQFEVKGVEIKRQFYFITQQGDVHPLQQIFLKHLSSDNFKL